MGLRATVVCSILAATPMIACGGDDPIELDHFPRHAGTSFESVLDGPVALEHQRIIYGEDDRMDVYAHPDEALRTLARQSIVALVPRWWVDGGEWPDDFVGVGELYGLCEDVRFSDQPAHAHCSGVLVDIDLVLTARHCLSTLQDCETTALVFDYLLDAPDHLAELTPDSVYFCRRTVAVAADPAREFDFVFLQLDRPVTEARSPARWRASREHLAAGESVRVLGFPMGIPLKIDSGGVVERGPPDFSEYLTTIDGFGGSSGSGVFDADGGLFGLLVAGPQDHFVSRGECSVLRNAGSAPGQSVVISLDPAITTLEDSGWRARLTDRDGACWSCRTEADCEAGHVCVSAQAPATDRWCARSCADASECAPSESCDRGHCGGTRGTVCVGHDVWATNACGRFEAPVEACGPDLWCADGVCGDPPLGRACSTALRLPAENFVGTGVFQGQESRMVGSCGGFGPEVIHRFTLERTTRVDAVASGIDAVLYIRRVCDDFESEVICVDDDPWDERRLARVEIELPAGTYDLVLDSYFQGGIYTITVEFDPQGCGCTTRGERSGPGSGLMIVTLLGAWRLRSRRSP